MYFTDRGIEELSDRRGAETVTIEWVATGIFSLTTDRNWVPLVVFAVVGFFFVLLGLYLDWRHRRREPAPPLPAV